MRQSTRSWLVIGLWLGVVLLAVGSISQTRFTSDMSAFLPASPSEEQHLLVEQLQEGGISRTFLLGISGGTAEQRAEASRRLQARLADEPAFTAVQNGGPAAVDASRAYLFDHRYLLSPDVDAERFTAEGLGEAIERSIHQLNSPLGDIARELFPRDPTGELMALLDDQSADQGPSRCCGVWMSGDRSQALLVARAAAPGSDTDGLADARERIHAGFAAVREGVAPDLQLTVAGSPAFAIEARDTIRAEVQWFTTLSVLLVASVLLLAYRSVPVLLAGLLPVGTGVVVGIAVVGLGFGEVHGITIGFGTALMGEAIDYSIYYFVQSRDADNDRTAERAWRADYWPTIRLGLVTSVIGFAALLFSGFPGLMQIGLYAISGLLAAALVTRYVLPVIGRRLPRADIAGLGRAMAGPVRALPRLRWPVLALGAAALSAIVFAPGERWRDTLSGLAPIDPALEAADGELREELGASNPRFLVVLTGPDREAALRAAENATPILDRLVAEGELAGYHSPTDILPSRATQLARQQALPTAEKLQRRLEDATADLPVSATRLQGFVEDVARQRELEPVTLADLEGTPLWLAIAGQLPGQAGEKAVAMITLRTVADTPPTDIERLSRALASVETAVVIDMLGESNRMYAHYLQTTRSIALAGAVAIVLLLLFVQRDPRRTLRTLLPLALAILFVIGGHATAGSALTLLHLVGLLLVVAIGSNYALFFQGRGGNSLDPRTLASLTLATLTTVTAFGVLAFSSVPVLQAIGASVAPGALAAWLLAAVFSDRTRQPAEETSG
ncbi:MMPL family transporter [Guyparkeria sp.]|uniref:MMPL family transporter n=1 Tax=Guyparkeria sp. TaxID=2035736 RepID=UPI003970646B